MEVPDAGARAGAGAGAGAEGFRAGAEDSKAGAEGSEAGAEIPLTFSPFHAIWVPLLFLKGHLPPQMCKKDWVIFSGFYGSLSYIS
jgi:hypothetical protein